MKQPLHVLVSHSGKTVELDVGAHARVGAVQQTLADLTGIPVGEQILMCEGARLDGAKPLAAYGLPGEDAGKVQDLFLYSRAHLRPSAVLPPAEALPPLEPDLSGVEAIRTQRHRLDAASSPLLRALPDYLRQFQEHLLTAAARHDACQHRLVTCARLLGEQEVQALSTDAATSNVELHYAYICDAYGAFMARYRQQAAAHADVLSRFESDLAYLAATDLHPALRISASAVSGSTAGAGSAASSAASGSSGAASQQAMQPAMASLLHLLNAGALRESAAGAARGHTHFGSKVSELEGLFGALKADVEALFMQAPSVDLEALARELEEMHGQVDEQASIVAALSSDLNKVQQLVEQASEQVASDPAASVQVTDTVHMLETMHETHVGHLLPRVTACHAAVEAFAARCLDCKNALTRDVFSQLHTISSQQSKIREMKNKLALFREALARQEGSVQELLVVRRVPAAYKQCLAECVRREAFMEKYAHSAAALAERMGVFREKELAMRDSFRKHVERLIPPSLLERMGLLEQPPHCQVSVSATEGERLLAVTLDDVRRIQLPWGAAQQQRAAQQQQQQPGTPTASDAEAAEQQQHGEGAAETDVTASLQLENAKLRAELASAIALDCIRAAQLATVGGMGGAAALTPRPCSGQASPLAASTASSPRGSTVVTAAGAAGGGGGAPLPADAAQRFERALSAKDGLVSELQAQLGASRQQAAAYEARIQALETQLTQVAAAADGRGGSAQPPLSVGSGMQQPPAPSSAPGSLMSRSGAAAAPPSAPHPLLSLIAALADEGSDVEGVEPVTDSEEEEEEDGRSSRGGGYGSAHSDEQIFCFLSYL
ncbi:Autophagy-related 11 [Micractinium conductrix]|uniref:Autophagy-related 11 n=1 Tax=Micractinium conductrix TaxID=554055 RepID=A0A2P6VBK9_9CHLO|nr:Autophagy-related 11 [Micractinium conductrix]|eukprot:PSC71466.1 Autophagy-related 11 [Micractinium conductrix]